MGKSILKRRSWERILTLVLVLAMLAAYVPAVGAARAADEAADSNVHVLNAEELETGTIAAGTVVGNYFTLLPKSTSAVNENSKTFSDGKTITKRINFGGKVTTSQNAIQFTTSGAAAVKVWWVAGGAGREMALLKDSDTPITQTTESPADNSTTWVSTLEITEAGTYYLGGYDNNNYIFRVEVDETPAAKEYTLDVQDEFKEAVSKSAGEEPAGTEGFFTILWNSSSNISTSSKTWEDGFSSGMRINFGGKATTAENSIRFTTNAAAKVTVWWAAGGDGRHMTILGSDGAAVAAGKEDSTNNSPYKTEFELDDAGTYYLGGDIGKNYIFKVAVTVGGTAVERAPWEEVAPPEIVSAAQDDDSGNITVTVNALIGTDYADKVTVTMTDEAGKTENKSSTNSSATEHEFTFTPSASGTYTFSVTAVRDGEETKHQGAETKTVDFVLPLATPNVKSVTNNGGGSVTVEWDPVPEATGYKVTVDGTDTSVTTTECSAAIEGLAVGETYTIEVVALRGDDRSEKAGSITCTVKDQKEVTWAFVSYGPSASTGKNKVVEGNANDGSVTLESTGGKIQDSQDGLGFYYTVIDPKTQNFILSATAVVNWWTYDNGQEGFGLMAADRIGAHGDTGTVWNNSYMAVVTKVEYIWDTDNNRQSTVGTKISMKNGIGAREMTGITPENVSSATNKPKKTMIPLETSCVALGQGTYNILGNSTNTVPNTVENTLTEFKFTLQKNNTGYFISYTNAAGETVTQKFYEPDALNVLDEDHVYVGFFVARNANVTFKDIVFTTTDAASDPEPEERPIDFKDPNYSIVSPANATKAEYQLGYYGNADGSVTVKDSEGNVLAEDVAVKANVKTYVPVTLTEGANTFTVIMTPDETYSPDGDYTYSRMSDYSSKTINITVNYEADTRAVVYVGPNGKASAAGTREDPTTIYEAVRKATPGQKIILLSGTYNLTSTVTIERGIDGTADAMIELIADPNGETRPVLDFGAKCEGVALVANYWRLYGFDVTNSADLKDGVHISGSNNVVERLLTYKNGNTGLQISRYAGSDLKEEWPANNLVLNCSSYLNADAGREDADGFAAKLTVGEGNVFDGCIAAYNADDGWDLFAKAETGEIGMVTIKNSVTFKNGYLLDDDGNEISAGNGNGFKMGGSNLAGAHMLINSVSFGNKAKGFDSNSCPDIKITNSTSFDNESYNVAFYTNNEVNTGFAAQGIISYKKTNTVAENIRPRGSQTEDSLRGGSNYYFGGSVSVNSEGVQVTDGWFIHLDMDRAIHDRELGIGRNEDGSINMNGFLVLTDKAPEDAGARLSPANWLDRFTDVSGADWFGDGVAYVVQNGLMVGVSDGKFNPNGTTTRGMLMTILARMNGVDTSGSSPWYQAGMEWSMRTGVSDGTSPSAVITREQFVTMLWRCAEKPAVTGSLDAYPDAGDVHSWASDAMVWAIQNNIIRDIDGELAPRGDVPRGEAADMLAQFCLNIVK